MSDPRRQVSGIRIPKNTATEVLKKLVKINSVNPEIGGGPGERKIAEEIARMLESGGLEVRTQRLSSDRMNVVGILRGEGGGKSLMLSGHMDTVGVEGMEIPPFEPVIKNGNLHGRGSCDMKGGLAAIISAAGAIARSKIRLRGDLYVSGVVDEEYISTGTEKLVEKYRTDGTVVGEPTRMGVGIAHMGYIWAEVETVGRTAHGSVPERGHDAIVDMARIIDEIEKSKAKLKRKKHPLLGSPKIHMSTVSGGQAWSVVPDHCHLRIERRTLPGEGTREVMNEVRAAVRAVGSRYPEVKARAVLNFERSPFEVPRSNPLSRSLAAASKSVTNKSAFVGVTYWSDASIFLQKGKMEACLFGPGDIGLAHSPLEYVPVQEVEDAALVYAHLAAMYCGIK